LVQENAEYFRFTAKVPKVITHDKRLKNISKELEYFHKAMLPLKDKTQWITLEQKNMRSLKGLEPNEWRESSFLHTSGLCLQ
jgi:Protein of unknown function DUF72